MLCVRTISASQLLARRSVPFVWTSQRYLSSGRDSLKEREEGLENLHIQRHEQDILKKLQEKLGALKSEQKAAPQPVQREAVQVLGDLKRFATEINRFQNEVNRFKGVVGKIQEEDFKQFSTDLTKFDRDLAKLHKSLDTLVTDIRE